ncbi:MAG: RNA 3'-terminal phosphate cyclase [Pseudomonadota bacterium]
MITIDGSKGEGGGQILRSSLALSAITGQAVRIQNVRGRRSKPGLLRQHLTALKATADVCGGFATGAELGSAEIGLKPGTIRGGDYEFSVGSAGSAMLVLQTVVPILLHADAPSTVTVSGGTHNMASPPFDFFKECYEPALERMGYTVTSEIKSWGFYPAGGGKVRVSITPNSERFVFEQIKRGAETSRSLESIVSNIKGKIAQRELETAGNLLGVDEGDRRITARRSPGPGNILLGRIDYDWGRSMFCQFGRRGITAESVAKDLADEIKAYDASGAAIDEYLADQLMLPMALGAGGLYSTVAPSLHSTTHAEIIERFTDRRVRFEKDGEAKFICEVR